MSKLVDDLTLLRSKIAARFIPDIDAAILGVQALEQKIDDKNLVIDAKTATIAELRDDTDALRERVERLKHRLEHGASRIQIKLRRLE